jgi:nucleoside-diphosphate-sugar epimerase
MNRLLVVGALGTVGRPIVEHVSALPDWQVVGLSRRAPDLELSADWVCADLRDRSACEDALSNQKDITHIVYSAVWEKGDVPRSWSEVEHAETNREMLRNVVEVVEKASPNLRHITLMQGTKAYGKHLGPPRMPSRESDPKYMPPNYYYSQQEWLESHRSGKEWNYTILRPQTVFGLAVGGPLNMITVVGVYAAISREYGMPLRFPGIPGRVTEATDARLLAKATIWAGTTEAAANQVYNITNGDVFLWEYMWVRLAAAFNMELGPPHPFRLGQVMPENGLVWDAIVQKYGLAPHSYKAIVPDWSFADFVLGHSQLASSHVSTIKIRQHGFHECIDTEIMFSELLAEAQKRKILPV